MSRRKKAEPTAAPSEPRKRRRRTKADQTAPQTELIPALAEAERLLAEKYPHINIKPGSLQPAGGRPDFGNKRTVIILCSACNKERTLATSDLFHVSHCRDCARAAKKAAKKEEQ
jgi:hypothetical protein